MKVIAEIGASHCGSLNNLLDLIELSKEAGADAVKFQCYCADDLTKPGMYKITKGLWKNQDLYELYKKAETPREWIRTAASHAQLLGIDWGVSVFTPDDVGYLADMKPSFFKIASFEIKYLDLIAEAGHTGIPLIISTGMADPEDIKALDYLGFTITLLACSSNYPSKCGELERIKTLKGFGHDVGLSDHTRSYFPPVMALAAGASVLEKHICFPDRSGPDGGFALSPKEFREMVEYVDAARRHIGTGEIKPTGDKRLIRRPNYTHKWVRGLNYTD